MRAVPPPAIERLRRGAVADAAEGVPGHVTLLYPFVAPSRLGADVRALVAAVAARHEAFDFELAGPARWPDTIYAGVDPVEPFVRLQADLERAFPGFPIYGPDRPFDYVPHVTIAEGGPAALDAAAADPAWAALPARRRAGHLEVIARPPGERWRTIWRVPLGGRRSGPDR